MKQITILSGKGGTGKTTITASFAALSENAVFADCDVDASNLHLLLNPEVQETIEFKGLKQAVIDPARCTRCGLCRELCRFNAIDEGYRVDPIHCEGCKVCVANCPVGAIDFVDRICGYAYISKTRYGLMSHARLTPGMENSGKLVALVRQNAQRLAEENGCELVLVDGPPGIGCPVISSLSNVDYSLVVVEPTLSGVHDLKRVLGLLRHFEIEPLVCVNKYDLNLENAERITALCSENGLVVAGSVPFDPAVTQAMVHGQPVVEYRPMSPASVAITEMFDDTRKLLGV